MMADLSFIYCEIILEFLFELYVFYGLTFFPLKRRPRFWPRALGGSAVILAVAGGAAVAYQLWGDMVLGRIGVYLILFLFTIAHMRVCFDQQLSTIIFCCSMAYAAQNMCYKLRLMVQDLCWEALDQMREAPYFLLYYRIVYVIFFAITAALAYFLFIRRTTRHLNNWQMDRQLLALCVFVLVIAVFLCSVEDIYFTLLSTQLEQKFDPVDYLVLKETGNLFSVTCCAIVLQLASRTAEKRELKQEVEYLQYAIRQGRRQYEIAKDTIDLINVKCHDIRYKIAALGAQNGGLGEKDMEDLLSLIHI